MKQTVNNLIADYNETLYKFYGDLEIGEEVELSGSLQQSRNKIEKLVGGSFNLPDDDFYAALFSIIEMARYAKQLKFMNDGLYSLLEQLAPEDVDVEKLEEELLEDYLNNHMRDK